MCDPSGRCEMRPASAEKWFELLEPRNSSVGPLRFNPSIHFRNKAGPAAAVTGGSRVRLCPESLHAKYIMKGRLVK